MDLYGNHNGTMREHGFGEFEDEEDGEIVYMEASQRSGQEHLLSQRNFMPFGNNNSQGSATTNNDAQRMVLRLTKRRQRYQRRQEQQRQRQQQRQQVKRKDNNNDDDDNNNDNNNNNNNNNDDGNDHDTSPTMSPELRSASSSEDEERKKENKNQDNEEEDESKNAFASLLLLLKTKQSTPESPKRSPGTAQTKPSTSNSTDRESSSSFQPSSSIQPSSPSLLSPKPKNRAITTTTATPNNSDTTKLDLSDFCPDTTPSPQAPLTLFRADNKSRSEPQYHLTTTSGEDDDRVTKYLYGKPDNNNNNNGDVVRLRAGERSKEARRNNTQPLLARHIPHPTTIATTETTMAAIQREELTAPTFLTSEDATSQPSPEVTKEAGGAAAVDTPHVPPPVDVPAVVDTPAPVGADVVSVSHRQTTTTNNNINVIDFGVGNSGDGASNKRKNVFRLTTTLPERMQEKKKTQKKRQANNNNNKRKAPHQHTLLVVGDLHVTEQSHMMSSQVEKLRKRQRKASSFGHSRPKTRPSTTVTTKHVTTKASIVGTRPQHWDIHLCQPSKKLSSTFAQQPRFTQPAGRSRVKRVSQLAEATKTSFLPPNSHHFHHFPPPLPPPPLLAKKKHGNKKIVAPPPSITRVSFAPAFQPRPHNTVTPGEEDKVDVEEYVPNDKREEHPHRKERSPPTTPLRTISTSPLRQHNQQQQQQYSPPLSRSKKAGTLIRRLRSIRAAMDGDEIRLQSGMYQGGTNDHNDPRNRARSFTDVTLMRPGDGDTVVVDPSHAMIAFHGFVHKHIVLGGKNEPIATEKKDEWVRLTFTIRTARSLKLTDHSQTSPLPLRIYNAVWIPSNKSVPTSQCGNNLSTLVCTQLSEVCPDMLPSPLNQTASA